MINDVPHSGECGPYAGLGCLGEQKARPKAPRAHMGRLGVLLRGIVYS